MYKCNDIVNGEVKTVSRSILSYSKQNITVPHTHLLLKSTTTTKNEFFLDNVIFQAVRILYTLMMTSEKGRVHKKGLFYL
jgi:hypothetical protein